jgi:hypothetical protein
MLKKMLIVATLLAVVSPAFGYDVSNSYGTKHGALEFEKDDDGKVIGWKTGPGNDRTVDWEGRSGADWTQRKAEVWNWPATYDYVPVCNIPVKMEIGFWIQVQNCGKNDLVLKQIKINTYRGSIDCTVSANVATQWAADWVKASAPLKKANKDWLNVSDSSSTTGDATLTLPKITDKKVWVNLQLKEVDLSDAAPTGTKVQVGHVTLKVRPAVKPNEYMSGASGSGAGWGSTGYQYYAPPQP